jgi:hypothetical protein
MKEELMIAIIYILDSLILDKNNMNSMTQEIGLLSVLGEKLRPYNFS